MEMERNLQPSAVGKQQSASESGNSPFIATLPRLPRKSWQRLNLALSGLETCLKASPKSGRIDADTAFVERLAAALRKAGGILIDEQLMPTILAVESWKGGSRFDTWAREFLHRAHPDLTTEQLVVWMQRPTGEGQRPGGDPVFFRHMADRVLDVCAILREATDPERPRLKGGHKDEGTDRPHGDGSKPELTAVERAMMLFTRDPNQSIRALARQVGCDSSLLYRDPRIRRLREAHRGKLPKGTKSREGDVEAEAED
jgi:hypothetical protein